MCVDGTVTHGSTEGSGLQLTELPVDMLQCSRCTAVRHLKHYISHLLQLQLPLSAPVLLGLRDGASPEAPACGPEDLLEIVCVQWSVERNELVWMCVTRIPGLTESRLFDSV